MTALLLALLTVGLGTGCGETEPSDDADCDATADADADGLDDCTEAGLGTDPQAEDSDGDGLSDGEEQDCVSDPLDADEQCYTCGWPHGDPGDLASTGSREGDVVDNLQLLDQCAEEVDLHDLAGQWTLAFITAEWCGACLEEANELDELEAEFRERTGLPFTTAVILFQDRNGQLPDEGAAERYHEVLDFPDHPVFADPAAAVLDQTPYTGRSLPGLCVLSPDMVMVECTTGHGKLEDLLALIEEQAG